MRILLIAVLAASVLSPRPVVARFAVQDPALFRGTITDSECFDANHGRMRMGETDAECVQACIDAHGATYVLYDGTTAYGLSDQQAPKAYAGRKVIVTGALDAKTKTIAVRSIAAQ